MVGDSVIRGTMLFNRLFPSCLLRQFQNKFSYETIQMKMTLISMKMDVKVSYEWFRTKTRFESEAKGNSEMAYLHCITLLLLLVVLGRCLCM